MDLLGKLAGVEQRFEELTTLLVDPAVIGDRDAYRKYVKEHSDLEPIVSGYRRYQQVMRELAEAGALLEESKDAEMRTLAAQEVDALRLQETALTQGLLELMLPKDPNDEKNIILEIRAGTGGDEAALFAADLFSVYVRFAEQHRWRVEMLSSSENDLGGFKEVIARIVGRGAYSQLKYERGVHRVQRVPRTETQGRIHTSTITVAVMPEAEEVEVEISDKDLRIDVFRAGGHGGQSVNTTDSAVRIVHLPTGLTVICQDEKSQHKNKAKGMMVLRARLYAMMQAEQDAQRRDDRRSQIGTGERSERIRTYNFPQGRVTDHRIGLTIYQLDSVMAGQLDLVIQPLHAHFRAQALGEGG